MNIFVGCSSSNVINKEYVLDCELLLKEIFLSDYDLVFGADDTGLMGLAYHIAKDNHRKVIGVCPYRYRDDLKKLECDQECVSDSVGDRTKDAIGYSDVILFLPGGIGTLYEFFTAVESKRSHEHDKPIILYNCYGYYDMLLSLLDKVYYEKFTSYLVKDNYYVCDSKKDVIKCLKMLKK